MIWNYSNGVLHLEAWLKGPLGGEQGLVSIICYRSSKASSKAGQAKAGRICAIIGMSITLTLWILNLVLIALGIVLS